MISPRITSNWLGGAGLMVHSWEADWTFMMSDATHYHYMQYHMQYHILMFVTSVWPKVHCSAHRASLTKQNYSAPCTCVQHQTAHSYYTAPKWAPCTSTCQSTMYHVIAHPGIQVYPGIPWYTYRYGVPCHCPVPTLLSSIKTKVYHGLHQHMPKHGAPCHCPPWYPVSNDELAPPACTIVHYCLPYHHTRCKTLVNHTLHQQMSNRGDRWYTTLVYILHTLVYNTTLVTNIRRWACFCPPIPGCKVAAVFCCMLSGLMASNFTVFLLKTAQTICAHFDIHFCLQL